MMCERCGGTVIWIGDLLSPTGTQCQMCGGLNCQAVDLDEYDGPDAGMHDTEIAEGDQP